MCVCTVCVSVCVCVSQCVCPSQFKRRYLGNYYSRHSYYCNHPSSTLPPKKTTTKNKQQKQKRLKQIETVKNPPLNNQIQTKQQEPTQCVHVCACACRDEEAKVKRGRALAKCHFLDDPHFKKKRKTHPPLYVMCLSRMKLPHRSPAVRYRGCRN